MKWKNCWKGQREGCLKCFFKNSGNFFSDLAIIIDFCQLQYLRYFVDTVKLQIIITFLKSKQG